MRLKTYARLLRPHHFIKNLLIFAPIFFALRIDDLFLLANSLHAFFAFSLAAGSVYIFNDMRDIEEDRRHPLKQRRVLPSGAVSMAAARWVMLLALVMGMVLAFLVNFRVGLAIAGYLVLNLFYTLGLKHIPIIDIAVIATGFVLRLFVGALATGIRLSMWIIVMTFLLALFLALAKRRDDVLIFNRSGDKLRKTVDGYNLEFLNAAMVTMAAVVIVSYILYTTSPEVVSRIGTRNLYLTTGFVVLGILRYMQIVFVEADSGNPTRTLLEDRFLQMTILAWLGLFAWILYQ